MKLTESLPESITVVEVGPRDGLQNQPQAVPAEEKVKFIEALADSGLPVVEATSFVSPKWVPQLADAEEVFRSISKATDVRYPVLVPNIEGLERAMDAGAREVSVFASATESFSKRNLNRSRDEAMAAFAPVVAKARDAGLSVRGYVSMVIGDPWEGAVDPAEVSGVVKRLLEMGADEISLGDTIGVGTPAAVERLLESLTQAGVKTEVLAVHFHDTYGQALVNVLTAMHHGVTIIDSSAGGIGGCPFAQSATGNLATEDLVWMLDGIGVKTGVDVNKVAAASARMCSALGIEPPSRVARALKGGDVS